MYVPVQIQIKVPLSFGGYRKNLCISRTFLLKFDIYIHVILISLCILNIGTPLYSMNLYMYLTVDSICETTKH